nr:hypothetical protein GCM10017547_26370 [Pseudarthrobacter oxydans]
MDCRVWSANNQDTRSAFALLTFKTQMLSQKPSGNDKAECTRREGQTDKSPSRVYSKRIGNDCNESE